MASIKIKFGIHLENYDLGEYVQRHGPLFNRWLPDGSNDAIDINTGDDSAKLKLWFDRRGYVETFIEFDYDRKEVDLEVMARQAVLDAGPLMGLLEIQDLSDEILNAIRNNVIGDSNYITFGKKIVKFIYPAVNRFINIIRVNFGQYWINPPKKWDSRNESLGQYCSLLSMKWSTDDGKTWADFQPNEPEISRITLVVRDDHQDILITRQDWERLSQTLSTEYTPSLAGITLCRTHQYLDQNQLRSAFIEGVSTLELALSEFIKGKLGHSQSLSSAMQGFRQLPLKTQLVALATSLGTVSSENLEFTLSAIEIRNRIVHDGLEPSESQINLLTSLLKTVSVIIGGTEFKFPSANLGNRLSDPTE